MRRRRFVLLSHHGDAPGSMDGFCSKKVRSWMECKATNAFSKICACSVLNRSEAVRAGRGRGRIEIEEWMATAVWQSQREHPKRVDVFFVCSSKPPAERTSERAVWY